jgi:uncharacterized membrane protein YfcA
MSEVVIFAAAFLAGAINSVAGGGTLVSFPALVWMGRDPILANATNAVALWPGSFASMLGFRRQISGSFEWILMLGAPSLLGGALGAFLLLSTPSETFSKLVPLLIFAATLLIALQEPISRLFNRNPGDNPSPKWRACAIGFQFLVAVYGGYFGAGIGILMLAALGLLGLEDIHRMNGLKNFFAFSINAVASIYFVISGKVIWGDALLMAVGAILGGYGGANLALRLGRRAVRATVVTVGFLMAISLLLIRR